jgi:hypothetical protein
MTPPEQTILSSPVSELDSSVGPLLLFLVSPYFMMHFWKKKKATFNVANLPLFSTLKKRTIGCGCHDDGNNFVAVQFGSCSKVKHTSSSSVF